MMAFTIASSKSMLERVRTWLVAVLAMLPVLVLAAEIEIANPQITASEDGFVISADFSFELNERLEEAVTKGVVLYFVTEFEMTRPRWYWLDEKVVSRNQTYRLSFHALTRQYRLSKGGLHQSFDTLSEALRVLSRLRNWVVIDGRAEKPVVQAGDTYMVALRMRLDINQLPRPFQISALGNKDWSLASEWKVWQTTLPAEAR
jgi:Domain of unknown function (DUF4390)